jgi:TRAP transporter 4TM/12TM fusion protein
VATAYKAMSVGESAADAGAISQSELDDMVTAIDVGARKPGGMTAKLLYTVALFWSLYQLYIASPLPFVLNFAILDDTQQRAIHLAFALFLGFLSFPAYMKAPSDRVPYYDWILGIIATLMSLYIIFFYADVSSRSGGLRTDIEIIVAVVGVIGLLEVTRRVLGMALVVVAVVFLSYAFFGPYMPEMISHRGVSISRFADHFWMTTEGVFGLPLGVSNSFVFLFVLFGGLLEKAGAGNFFIKLSFSLLGHLRGGPGKAAVVSSALTGLVSGSAIANVVTTGTFTIPLMKRSGFKAEKAAAIEVSSSINGQLMPPVMGAAAFLMTELVGISYFEVIKAAFLPAVISYIGLFYIVHLEAIKGDMPVLEKIRSSTRLQRLLGMAMSAGAIIILSALIYYAVLAMKAVFGDLTLYISMAALFSVYVGLLWVASRNPEIEVDDPNAALVSIPDTMPVLLAGLYYLIPVSVLVWALMVERLSPGLSASWAIVAMVILMLTQRPITAFFRGRGNIAEGCRRGFTDLIDGLVGGARNMVGIAIAMGAAGIIVGVVSLTGLGLVMTEVIDAVAGGNVLLMLIATAIMSIILGMGLPTTANYIVVASIMAQPLVTLASQNGLIIPVIGVHLFVFYFGLLAGTTPPVAVDAFAGAAIARADPMKTCLHAFMYNLRTAILPFIFIFNPGLLLIGVDNWWQLLLTVSAAVIAMLTFAAATKSHFLTSNRRWESAALLLVAFTLLRPGYWLDQVADQFVLADPVKIVTFVSRQPDDASIRLLVEGENFSGDWVRKVVLLPLGTKSEDGAMRLYESAGLGVVIEDGQAVVDEMRFNSPAQKWSIDFGWIIKELQVPVDRVAKEWFYIPAYAILALIVLLQLRRRRFSALSEGLSGAVPSPMAATPVPK